MGTKKVIVDILDGPVTQTQFVHLIGASNDGCVHTLLKPVCDLQSADQAIDAAYERGFREAGHLRARRASQNLQVGDYVILWNGVGFELGKVKRIVEDGAFVYFNSGSTAAKAHFSDMYKLMNADMIGETALGGTTT